MCTTKAHCTASATNSHIAKGYAYDTFQQAGVPSAAQEVETEEAVGPSTGTHKHQCNACFKFCLMRVQVHKVLLHLLFSSNYSGTGSTLRSSGHAGGGHCTW